MKRDKWVHIKVSEDERAAWHAAAAAAGVTVADMIRRALESAPVRRRPRRARRPAMVVAADPALVREMARIGNNLNQIARWANTHKSAADAVQVLAALSAIERELLQALSSFLPPASS